MLGEYRVTRPEVENLGYGTGYGGLMTPPRVLQAVVGAAIASSLLFAACSDGTGPDIPSDLAGVWTAVLPYIGPADTLTLLIPEQPDSFAFALRRPGSPGYIGVVRRSGRHLTGTFAAYFGGGFGVDLFALGGRLFGTLRRSYPSDSIQRVVFERYAPTGPDVAGTWVTSSVTGVSPDIVYLDTLRIKRDGRVKLASSFATGGFTTCGVSGMPGVYRREQDRLILTYLWTFWPFDPCPHLRLVDTLQVSRTTLARVRHFTLGDVVETLTRR